MDPEETYLLEAFTKLEAHYLKLASDPIYLYLIQTKARLIDAILNGVPEFPNSTRNP